MANKKPKYSNWYCKYCKTFESCPDLEYNKTITAVYCPTCAATKKKRKMIKQDD